MEDNWRPEVAEAIPFTRASIAYVLDIKPRILNNWIDRNRLWQTPRLRYYRLSDVFDLAGFAAMRAANISEKDCALYVRNFGFYGGFLHGNQIVDFSYRKGKWDIGVCDPNAIVTLRINMRAVGEEIFRRIALLCTADGNERSKANFESYRRLYLKAVELERLWPNSIPHFEIFDR